MTDDQERGLVMGTLAAPDDDTPRLIYADWMEEHGAAERAAFVRRQCAPGPARRLLTADERAHATALPGFTLVGGDAGGGWVCYTFGGEHPRVRAIIRVRFSRGFAAEIETTAAAWLEAAAALYWAPGRPSPCPLTAQPLRRVTWTDLPDVAVGPVFDTAKDARRCLISAATGPAADRVVTTGEHAVPFLRRPAVATQRIALAVATAEWPSIRFTCTPYTTQIADMAPGEVRYTVPWAVMADDRTGELWVRGDYPASLSPQGTTAVRVTRTQAGVVVDPGEGARQRLADAERLVDAGQIAHAVRHWRALRVDQRPT